MTEYLKWWSETEFDYVSKDSAEHCWNAAIDACAKAIKQKSFDDNFVYPKQIDDVIQKLKA